MRNLFSAWMYSNQLSSPGAQEAHCPIPSLAKRATIRKMLSKFVSGLFISRWLR